MKKTNLFLTCALASCVLVTSCKEDVEETYVDESGQVKETSPGKVSNPETFSTFTPEENKAQLEDDGLELLSNMEDLSKSPAIEATASFVGWLDRSSAAPANGRLAVTSRTLQAVGSSQASARDIFVAMRTAAEPGSESEASQSIQDFYDQYTGVWSWNASTQMWDHQAGGSTIVFEFPATEAGTQNNAKYTIHSYEGLSQDHPYTGYEGDLPTKIVAELTVDGVQQSAYSFEAAYNQKGEPEQLVTSLSVNTFVFSIAATNTSTEAGIQYALKRDNKTLLAMGSGVYGNFSADHLSSLDDNSHQGDVVNRVDAYFQLMNVVVAGDMDIKKYLDGYEDNYTFTGETYYDDNITENNAELLEEAFNLNVFYADGSGKIADTEVYTSTNTYTDYEWYYDETTENYQWKEEEVEYKVMNVRMVFEDDSRTDFETYFSEGFDDLIAEFHKFAEESELDID